MNGFELCKLLRRQPLKKRAGWRMAQENCGETLGDIEPVYNLFSIMGKIIPSESLSRHLHRNEEHAFSEDNAALLERTEPERRKAQ